MKTVSLVVGVLSLSACSIVGPDYTAPQILLSDRFTFAASTTLQDAARDTWWTSLNDPVLDGLMRQGLQSNLDIRTARARIAESEALLRAEGVAASQLSGSLTGQLTRTRADGVTIDTDQARVGGSFVFDLFGRAARRRERARASLEATGYDAASARLAYQAELAAAVVEARFFQAALRSTNRTIESQRRILSLTRQMVSTNQLTRDNEARAMAELAQTQAQIPGLRNGLHLNSVRVATLLDEPVGPILERIRGSGGRQPEATVRFGAGLPADLLRNRPDVISAERRLAAAFAGIGVAEADLYPALTLDGSITVDSTESFSLGPRLSLPVLGRGRLISLRDASASRADQAELAWRASVRGAIGDVERALINIDTAREEITALGRALRQFRELLRLSEDTFSVGSITLLELLDTEQDVQRAELNLARAWRDLAHGIAQLAVATGRGAEAGLAQPAAAAPEGTVVADATVRP